MVIDWFGEQNFYLCVIANTEQLPLEKQATPMNNFNLKWDIHLFPHKELFLGGPCFGKIFEPP